MKWLLLISLICILNSTCEAQIDSNSVTGKKVITKMHQLRLEKIDTTVCYYLKCSGRMPKMIIPDSCTTYDIVYLLWGYRGTYFIQKFDECNDYNAATMDGEFIHLIKTKYPIILREKIYPPECTLNKKGKSVTYSLMRDHTCHTIFEMHLSDSTKVAGLNNYEMDTKYIDGSHLNINYYRNQRTILNKLKIIVEKQVAILK